MAAAVAATVVAAATGVAGMAAVAFTAVAVAFPGAADTGGAVSVVHLEASLGPAWADEVFPRRWDAAESALAPVDPVLQRAISVPRGAAE